MNITQNIKIGPEEPLLLIAGPCQAESLEHSLTIAEYLQELITRRNFAAKLVFKASYDKANRTSLSGKRGPGIQAGLNILAEVKNKTKLPILTDVHSTEQVTLAAEVADILQIPAFLCRQTDLLVAAGNSGRAVNVKKGQFLAPEDMRFAAEKIASSGNDKILLCERGTCFGYRDLVVDMRGLHTLSNLGYPVIFDATHSVQSMGGTDGASSGNREYIAPLVRAACAVGIDGLFIECHDNPDSAPSDGPNMLPLEQTEQVIEMALRFREVALLYRDR